MLLLIFDALLAPLDDERHPGPEPYPPRAGHQAAPPRRCIAGQPGARDAQTASAGSGDRRLGVSRHARHAVGAPGAKPVAPGYQARLPARGVAPAPGLAITE